MAGCEVPYAVATIPHNTMCHARQFEYICTCSRTPVYSRWRGHSGRLLSLKGGERGRPHAPESWLHPCCVDEAAVLFGLGDL
jgi:hypothetical protein